MNWLFSSKKKQEPRLNCPRCDLEMIKKKRMGVTIDKCGKCGGIWLDNGEIEKILEKLDAQKRRAAKE
jgi:Zn-finger nucleic acid-binding protein